MRINMLFIITMLSVFERCTRVHFLLQVRDDTGGPFRFRITSTSVFFQAFNRP